MKNLCFLLSKNMRLFIAASILWAWGAWHVQAQVGINPDGAQPHPSAMLDVKSTNKGILIPRMTAVQRAAIPSPANGLMVFDTDSSAFAAFIGTAWVFFKPYASASNRIVDGDGDTWINTQTGGTDGDSLVFHLGDAGGTGTTEMVLVKNFSNIARLELPDERENTFVGQHSGEHTGQGYYNVGLGTNALHANVAGWGNTALGSNALRLNTSGEYNTAVGRNALYSNIQGKGNVAVGAGAMRNADMSFTVAVGDSALFHLVGNSSGVTAVGSKAGFNNNVGHHNTFIGSRAGYSNSNGASNTFLGYQAGYSNSVGWYNTFVGQDAGYSNQGVGNTAVGSEALLTNTTGESNTAIGRQALLSNIVGDQNTALGWHALLSNNGDNNTGVGSSALASNTTGYDNAAFGINALQANVNGHSNTALGTNPLYSNTGGYGNAAVGRDAMYYNTTGYANTAIGGDGALSANTAGYQNTACGNNALFANTTGNENTAVGQNALSTNGTGSRNTAVGRSATTAASALSNTTAIGFSAVVNASNKVRVGSNSVSVIEGQVAWSYPSDARFKYNVTDNDVPGLALIEKLRPVNYQFDVRKFDRHVMKNLPAELRAEITQTYPAVEPVQTGFLAQEVEQACKELNYSFSGLHVPENDTDNYSIAYGSFVPLLVKAVQEQQDMIEKQQAEINKLKQENNRLQALEARILALENQKQ